MQSLEKQYYRPEEVAQLRVSVRTARRWAAHNRIEHVHTPGKAIRIPQSEVVRLLCTKEASRQPYDRFQPPSRSEQDVSRLLNFVLFHKPVSEEFESRLLVRIRDFGSIRIGESSIFHIAVSGIPAIKVLRISTNARKLSKRKVLSQQSRRSIST
jgi:excisionase family DNA binding protein